MTEPNQPTPDPTSKPAPPAGDITVSTPTPAAPTGITANVPPSVPATSPATPTTGITAAAPAVPSSGVAPSAVASKPPPPPPPKPAATPAAAKGGSRRFFLFSMFGSWISIAWLALSASAAGLTLGTVRFLFPNVLSEPPSSFKAGDANNYEENKVDDRFKEQGAWVVRARDDRGRDIIYALSTTCTHLGCTPNWLESEKKFKCPCHGSGFKISGINFEGPAPRPLERYAIRKTEDGQITVDKSRKFQREQGQWDDADSYILL